MKDIVFTILETMLRNSPEASYKRLNPALRGTLAHCIEADLPFQADTFKRINEELRGGWWFGDGAGSSAGEHYYSLACAVNHNTAAKSFEAFAERPGVLWEQDGNTPERLHVGSNMTWQGHYLTVTSMRDDSLVACSYKDTSPSYNERWRIGSTIGYDKPHVITSIKRDGKATLLRVIPAKASSGHRTIAKRFTITYAEIAEYRRTENARVKAVITEIETCDPVKDGTQLSKRISAEHFRHFQLEKINAAFAKRKGCMADEDKIAAWRSGANGAWLDIKSIVLRVRGDLVECSNGNSVSLAAVRRALPIVIDRRQSPGTLTLPLDGYTINATRSDGVKVGCTLVPWPEVEQLQAALK